MRATALDAVKAGFRARVLLDYSVGVAPDTTGSTLEDFRQAGVTVSGQAPVSQWQPGARLGPFLRAEGRRKCAFSTA